MNSTALSLLPLPNTHRLTRIRSGFVINFEVISNTSAGRVALTRTTCTGATPLDAHTHVYIRTYVRTQTTPPIPKHGNCHNTSYTHLYLYLYSPLPETVYVAPYLGVSQQEATRLVAPLAAGTPALSPQLHGPLTLICGLARPTR